MRHLPRINIETIPHSKQRYDTAGDYWLDKKGVWQFRISEMKSIYYEMFVLIHELWEWLRAVIIKGIKEEDITYFDTHEGKDSDDPGTMKSAPYHIEHMSSMKVEKLLCKEVKMDWKKYDKSFSKLKYKQ